MCSWRIENTPVQIESQNFQTCENNFPKEKNTFAGSAPHNFKQNLKIQSSNDREILAKTDPNFSKTTFKDVGHALSDSEFDFNTKTSKSNLSSDVADAIEDEGL